VYLFVNFFCKHYYYDIDCKHYYYDFDIQYSGTVLHIITGESMHTALKQWHCVPHLMLHCKLCSICYIAVQINTSAIKVGTMKIMDDFCYEWKSSCAYHKIDTIHGEQRWMEGTGKSMKNALHLQRYGKRHLLGWSNVKQWKN